MRGVIILGTVFFTPAVCLPQTTWYVPDDFTTIQVAVSDTSVVDGDTIIVRPGTYIENIDFLGKAITVKSEQGPEATVIDGSNPIDPDLGSVASFKNGEGTDSILQGFTLIKGTGTCPSPSLRQGGGIYCNGASPAILDNIITGNQVYYSGHGGGIYLLNASGFIIKNNSIHANDANYAGGGIYCEQCTGVIEGNLIYYNEGGDWEHGYGGGIYCISSTTTIDDNIIHYNLADGSGGGGGICCFGGSTFIRSNDIYGNTAIASGGHGGGGILGDHFIVTDNSIISNQSHGSGGGIYGDGLVEFNSIKGNSVWGDGGGIYGGTLISANLIIGNSAYCGGGICSGGTITNNMIIGNTADAGGGIYSLGGSSMSVTNNTICMNQVVYSGGGIYSQSTTMTVLNTILWNNQAGTTGPEIKVWGSIPLTFNISYSDVRGGKPSVHVEPGSKLNWGFGMIDADPLFVNPSIEDYHLSWLSPCINRGTINGAPPHDIDGLPRPYMGTVDMGADEYMGDHLLGADVFTLSEATGGAVNFKIIGGGPQNLGRTFILLGSVTGTAPGNPLPGGHETLPLNWDLFTNIVIENLNTPLFKNFSNTFWTYLTTYAKFDTLGPLPPGTAGITFHFAYALAPPPAWDFVSNPVAVTVIP